MIFTGYDELAYFLFLGTLDTFFRLYSKTLMIRVLSTVGLYIAAL